MAGGTRQGSALLAQTRQRFARWRQTRKSGTRIPEALWAAAVRVARVQGPGATANALGIDFYALKRRMGHSPAESSKYPQFVELRAAATPPAATPGVTQCVLELEDAGGTKLRVQLSGVTAADIADVIRRLWSART